MAGRRAPGRSVRVLAGQLDRDRIVAAIREAEATSTGEIRVYVSRRRVRDPRRAAAAAFRRLGMEATRERNGVLVYVAPRVRRFAVYGDAGIHERCGEGFWREVAAAVEGDFRAGRFTDGIVAGIRRLAGELGAHFPRTGHDRNELPDQPVGD